MKMIMSLVLFFNIAFQAIGSANSPSEMKFRALMAARGTDYILLRDYGHKDEREYSFAAEKTAEERALIELLKARMAESEWITAFDEIVVTDLQMRKTGKIRVDELAETNPSYAPLALAIRYAFGKNKNNGVAARHIALAAFEYLSKLADDEYEVFNSLRIFDRHDLMMQVREAVLPEVVHIVLETESKRVTYEAARLFYKYGLPGDDFSIIEEIFRKYPEDVKVLQALQSILRKYDDIDIMMIRELRKKLNDQIYELKEKSDAAKAREKREKQEGPTIIEVEPTGGLNKTRRWKLPEVWQDGQKEN